MPKEKNMKRIIRRLLSIAMATVLVASSLSTSVMAASEVVSTEAGNLESSVGYDMDNIKVINTSTGEVYDGGALSVGDTDLESLLANQTGEEADIFGAAKHEQFRKALSNNELNVMDASSEEFKNNLNTYSLNSGQELKIWVCDQSSAESITDYDFSYVDGRLKLSKEGFYPIDINVEEVGMADTFSQTDKTIKLALVPKSSKSNIAAVYCNGKDVLAEGVSIPSTEKGLVSVYVVTADGTNPDADLAVLSNRYDPKSGDLLDRKVGDGRVTEIKINPTYLPNNAKNNELFFRIYNDYGDEDRSSIHSNLTFLKDEPKFAIGFDRDLTFTIPKNIPVIGGGDVSLEVKKLPIVWKVQDHKVRVGINTRADLVNNGEKWSEYKTWIEDSAKNEQMREDSIDQFLDKKNTPFKAGIKGGFNLKAGGMFEFDIDGKTGDFTKVGGYLYLSVDVSVNGEWQVFVVVVPIVIKFTATIGLNAFVGLGYDIKNHKAYFNGQVSFIIPKLRLSAGIGCAKVADVSVYGQGANKLDFDMSVERGVLTGALEGEAGVTAKLLFLKYEKSLWKGRWQYFRGTIMDSKGQREDKELNKLVLYYPEDGVMYTSVEDVQAEIADLDNYTIDRSYVDTQSEWLPEEENQDGSGALNRGGENNSENNRVSNTVTLQKSVFFSASPQIIVAEDGTKLLVWTSDIKERATGDHTAIVYSIYDDVNNVWCEPEIIHDDGTLDSNPQVIAVGNKIYIAWMDSSKKGYGDEVRPSDLAVNMEISVAEFDTRTKSVTKIMNTGTNDSLEMYPHLFKQNNEAYLAWVTNSENDFYGAGRNTVKYANLSLADENTLSGTDIVSTDNAIEDIAIGEIGSKLCISYILGDADSSQEENHKHGIHVKTVSDNEIDSVIFDQELTKPGLKMSKVNGKNVLTWCSEDKIYYSEDGVNYGVMDAVSDISPDYVITNRNGKDVLLCTKTSEKETDIFYHEMEGYSIKNPVQISEVDEYVTSFSAADTFDSFEIAYSKTESAITSEGVHENRDICIKSIPTEGYNEIEIVDCYHDEKQIKSNATVPFEVTVKNNGLIDQDCVRYTVYKNNVEGINRKYIVGDLNNLQMTPLSLPVGETATFTVDVPVGEIDGNSIIGIMVDSGDNDSKNPHFDTRESNVGYPDLQLTLDSVNSEYNYAVNAEVSNVGAADTKAYLNIIEGGEDGEILKTCYLGTVKAGETNDYEISSDVMNSINFNQETVTFEVVATDEEYYVSNNTDFIHKHIDGLVVRFDADGGVCKTETKTIAPGKKYGGLPQAQKTGYTFLGWYDGDKKITADTNFTEDSPRELTAKWEANEYTVSFDTGYDIDVDPIQVKYGEAYGMLPKPNLPGVTFEGWYYREKNEKEGLVNYEITPETIAYIAENHVLHAQVKPINETKKPVFYDGDTGEELTGNVVLKKGKTVKIKTKTNGATLYYTTDRTDPDPVLLGGGTIPYEDEITVSKNVKIKAIAAKHGYGNSPVAILNVIVEDDWGDIDNPQAFNNDISKVPSGLWISGVENKTYTGKEIKQDIKVYYNTTLLKENKDYDVSYKNNINVGNAQITVTGKSVCKGKATETFSIGHANISTSRLIADDIILEYNGNVQKGKTAVKYRFDDRTVTLVEGRDYILDYDTNTAGYKQERAYVEEGDYRILICGIGNYNGSAAFNEEITKCSLISKAKVSKLQALNYDGTAKVQQNIEVKYAGKNLVAGEDYKVSYENNILPGTATMIITGINKYKGAKRINFAIKGTDIKKTDITISNITSYTGEKIEPTVSIKDKNSVSGNLIEGTDYTVSYSNNVNAGKKAVIIIKGLKGYTGTVNKTFAIEPYEINATSGNRVQAYADASVKYTKGGAKPLPVLSDGSYTLINGKDYKIKYKNNANVHSGTGANAPVMEVSGIGNYSGKVIFNYAIEKKSVSDNEISISVKDVIYKNKAGIYKSKVVVKDANGKKLSAGKDYKDVVYSYGEDTVVKQMIGKNNYKPYIRKAGEKIDDNDIIPVETEIIVTLSGTGNYNGEGHADFRFISTDISKVKVSIAPKYYTGKAVRISKNDITSIMIGKAELSRNDIEIVGYKNNINPGKATVIIRGKGTAGGEKEVTFIILPQETK